MAGDTVVERAHLSLLFGHNIMAGRTNQIRLSTKCALARLAPQPKQTSLLAHTLPLRLSITVASLPCYFTSPSLTYTLLLVVCVLLQHFAGIIRWQDMVVQYGLAAGCSTIKDY